VKPPSPMKNVPMMVVPRGTCDEFVKITTGREVSWGGRFLTHRFLTAFAEQPENKRTAARISINERNFCNFIVVYIIS